MAPNWVMTAVAPFGLSLSVSASVSASSPPVFLASPAPEVNASAPLYSSDPVSVLVSVSVEAGSSTSALTAAGASPPSLAAAVSAAASPDAGSSSSVAEPNWARTSSSSAARAFCRSAAS